MTKGKVMTNKTTIHEFLKLILENISLSYSLLFRDDFTT
jgi:hypothetical protein